MTNYDSKFLASLSPEQQKTALTKRGKTFVYKFLFKRGDHLFIIGNTGSGKTQKAYWLVNWMRHTKETVIWLDSAKNREIVPLLTMGTPIRVIVPRGANVTFTEWNPEQKAYTEMKNPPEIMEVPDAGTAWWAVKRGMINIFCFRNAFDHAANREKWMAELFETLSTWTRKQRMPHVYPFCLIGDEAHWFNAGQKITSDTGRNLLSELITEHALEIRAYGGRLVLIAQGYKNLPPATRENLPNNLLCRGAKVSSDENNALSIYNQFTSRYTPDKGLFVYSDGSTYPHDFPWPFPFFEMPKIKVHYSGEYDDPSEQLQQQQEIEQEMTPDLSKYNTALQDLKDYQVPANINRYEALPDDT